jgi:hypothetical protein
VGWQWPLTRLHAAAQGRNGSAAAAAAWYSVGRINYSLQDSRITDSVSVSSTTPAAGSAASWPSAQSTGLSEATTRLLLQLELVGLSRIGSNPLQVLKDNIPGYRLLREERGTPARPTPYD